MSRLLWSIACALLLVCTGCMTSPKFSDGLAGTTWAGTDSDGDYYENHFLRGRSLHYKSPTGSWTNGSWIRKGDFIYFEMNKGFSKYRGIISGERMKGEAENSQGHSWTWMLEKVKEPTVEEKKRTEQGGAGQPATQSRQAKD